MCLTILNIESTLIVTILTLVQHDALLTFRYQFLYLQIELALNNGGTKFAKNTCRKAISTLTTSHTSLMTWLYRFHLLYLRICQNYDQDYATTLSSLRDLLALTQTRKDTTLEWIVRLEMARISMLEGDALLSSLLSHLSESAGFNLPMSNRDLEEQSSSEASTNNAESSRTEPLGIRTHLQLTRTVVTQYLVLLGLWQAHIGELKAAKSTVKRVHAMLDEGGVEAGEQEGWIAVRPTYFR